MSRLSIPIAVALLCGLAFSLAGCQSAEEKANEEAVKSRDAQAAQMGGHVGPGAGAPRSGPPPSGN